MIGAIAFVAMLLLAGCTSILIFALHIYGIVLSFTKKWYFGVIALLVPWFAVIVGGAKYFAKKDLLK